MLNEYIVNQVFMQNLWDLLDTIDNEYIEASNYKCTCDTDSGCTSCDKWIKVAKKIKKMQDRVGEIINAPN